MNQTKHITILYIGMGILTIGFISFLVYAIPSGSSMMQRISMMGTSLNDGGDIISDRDMDEMMNRMMGTTDETNLKTVTPEDRIPQLQPAVLTDSTKEFTLNAEPILWEYADGKTVTAWGYNGQVPGPEIRVTEGDKIKVVFTNKLPKATTIHWHGIDVPYTSDGVPGVTQAAIQPSETYTYEFTATPSGTRFYHTHGSGHDDSAQQMDMGLAGAFIIEPKIGTDQTVQKPDQDITLVLDEWQTGSPDGSTHNMAMMDMNAMGGGHMMNYNVFTINGRAFPGTEAITVKAGEKIRVRLINAGSSTTHPIHLHGQSFKVVAVDGNAVPEVAQLTRDTISVAPGERYDIEWTATNPGIWMIHCHELHHADAGMVMPLVYDGFELPDITAPTETTADSTTTDNNDMMGGHSMHGN